MAEDSRVLDDRSLLRVLGLRAHELDEVVGWGLQKKPGVSGIREDDLRDWLEISKQYPGVFVREPFAAALLGLIVAEFRRNIGLFESARTRFDDKVFWKHRLWAIYRANLRPDTVFGSLIESHRDFAARLHLRLASCVVCGEKAVSTVCSVCGKTVDPAHCEDIKDGRPLPFRPAEVCFNCIRDKGVDTFRFFRDRQSVRTSVERVLGSLRRT